nr:proline-rich receptor-like protein kinase PERK9 [Aegilops tauschii subsp. strangulata]
MKERASRVEDDLIKQTSRAEAAFIEMWIVEDRELLAGGGTGPEEEEDAEGDDFSDEGSEERVVEEAAGLDPARAGTPQVTTAGAQEEDETEETRQPEVEEEGLEMGPQAPEPGRALAARCSVWPRPSPRANAPPPAPLLTAPRGLAATAPPYCPVWPQDAPRPRSRRPALTVVSPRTIASLPRRFPLPSVPARAPPLAARPVDGALASVPTLLPRKHPPPLHLAAALLLRLPPPRRSPSGGRWSCPGHGSRASSPLSRARLGSARRPRLLRPSGPMTMGPHSKTFKKRI